METDKNSLIRPLLVGLATGVLIFAMVWQLQQAEQSRRLEEARAKVLQTVSLIRARLEGTINSHVFLARGLAAHVATHPDIGDEEFRAIAREIVRSHEGIRSVQLAKDSVVTHIYPREGNEAALGLRPLDLPAQQLGVQRALDSGDTVLAGPVQLVQGGVALISRTPVYLPAEEGAGRGPYWGLATVLLDLDFVFHKVELEVLAEGLRLAIKGRDGLGDSGEVFYGDPAVFDAQPIIADVALPNGTWRLAVLPTPGWKAVSQAPLAAWLAGIVFATIAASMIGLLAYRSQKILQVNHQLEVARRQAERAVAERTRFLAAASHDLRQPLHALTIFISDLRERSRHVVDLQPLIEKIQFSAEALNELFHSLMDISRLDAGATKPEISEFSLQPLLQKLVVENAPSALEKGLRLRVASTRAVVRSDPILLECLLRNLIVNAIKYTRRGGILVGCRPRGDDLRIEVWDSGPGIPEAEQANIFNEFYQLGNPERDRRKGLGLGLAIVRRIANLLGHRIEVRSQLRRGTMFAVEVPRGAAVVGEPVDAKLGPAGLSLRGAMVIVVDDEMLILEAMRSLLEQWGCRVVTARSGAEAEQALRETGLMPELILCDYRLAGGETGDQVIRRLRAAAAADLPACLISGDIAEEVCQAAKVMGCRLLSKPVPPAKLRMLLRNVVRGPGRRDLREPLS